MADKSKDTGTGGINIDGKIYTVDVGVPDSQGGAQGNYSSGNITVDKTVKDISKPTRETFAKYLSNSTLAKVGDSIRPNPYPVGKGDQTTTQPLALRDNKGYPARPAHSANEANFSSEFSSTMGAPAPLPLKKGLSDGNGPDGNTLLSNAASPGGSNVSVSANFSLSLSGVTDAITASASGLGGGSIKYTQLQEPLKSYTSEILEKNLYSSDSASVPSFRLLGEPLIGFYGPDALRKPLIILDDGNFENLVNDPIIRTITGRTAITRAMDEVAGENTPGGIKNTYAPESGFFETGFLEFVPTVSLVDSDGYPTPPAQTPDYSYAKKLSPTHTDQLAASTLKTLFRRGKAPGQPNDTDGHTLLRTGNGDDFEKENRPYSEVSNYVSQVLKVNRFDPVKNKSYIPNYLKAISTKSAIELSPEYKNNAAFARHDELQFGVSGGNDDNLKRKYDYDQLSKVAGILTTRATQIATPPGSDPEESLLQSSVENINIETIIRDLSDYSSSQYLPSELSLNSNFQTILNNIVDKFSGLSNETQIATAMALVACSLRTWEKYIQGRLLESRSVGSSTSPTFAVGNGSLGTSPLGIGVYLENTVPKFDKSNFNLLTEYNIIPTNQPYGSAVYEGMLSFFNITRGSSGQAAYSIRPTQNISYKLVLARSIIRAATHLNLLLKQIEQDSDNRDPQEKYYETLKAKRDSRLFGIFNFFAKIGDTLTIETNLGNIDIFEMTKDQDGGRKISTIDYFAANVVEGPEYGKNRILRKGNFTKLAWGVDQTPDLLVRTRVPSLELSNKLKGPSLSVSKRLDPTSLERTNFRLPNLEGRLTTAQRLEFEKQFDSEYVPFYFHDVRTNEILGFHAFITSLTDDYTAGYESVDGFGRIEPVKIYKNTQRKIGISFLVAALDAEDYQIMWTKINKLTTLVYPQYTSGRRISITDPDPNKEYDFVKPFTQQIAASPLVRLRLGNLIASNYSKFNLSKIFGLHEKETLIAGMDFDGTVALQRAQQKAEQKKADAARRTALAKGKLKRAEDKYKNLEKDKYNQKYDYRIVSGASVLAIQKHTIPEPEVDKQKSKNSAKDQTKNAAEVKSKEVWQAEKNKLGKVLEIANPTDGYALVATVESVLTKVSEQGVDAKGSLNTGASDNDFQKVDPTKDYDDKTIFQVTLKKVPIALVIDENRTRAFDAEEGGYDKNNEEDKKQVEKDLIKQDKFYQDKQKKYDSLVAQKQLPDISKYKFLVSKKDIKMTHYSERLYEDTIDAAEDEADDAELAADEATQQQAIDEAAANDEYAKRQKEIGPAGGETAKNKYMANVDKFMGRQNSIVRSFESTGGQGLAGFIESMSFDWYTGVTWDTERPNTKAPKMCKVTLSFSPIHDIPPGLGGDGENRAPIYPVGEHYPYRGV